VDVGFAFSMGWVGSARCCLQGRMVRHTYLGGILPTSAVASKL